MSIYPQAEGPRNSRAAEQGMRRLRNLAAGALAVSAATAAIGVHESNKANEPVAPVHTKPSALTQQIAANTAVMIAEKNHHTIKVDVQDGDSVPVLVHRTENIKDPALETAVEHKVAEQALGVGPEGRPELRNDQSVYVPIPEGAQLNELQYDPAIHVDVQPQG